MSLLANNVGALLELVIDYIIKVKDEIIRMTYTGDFSPRLFSYQLGRALPA